jgi:hypothetical protein
MSTTPSRRVSSTAWRAASPADAIDVSGMIDEPRWVRA